MNWRLLAVVGLVVLAGCGSFVGQGDDGGDANDGAAGTVTPAPVPEVTPTPEQWPVAPGLSTRGVENVNALIDAHLSATSATSYEFTEWRGSASPPDESARLFRRTRATVASSQRYRVWTANERVRIDGAITHVGNYTEYVDNATRRVRYRLAGQTEPVFGRQHAVAAEYNEHVGGRATLAIRQYLTLANTSVARTTVDGQRYYEVTAFERSPETPNRRNLSVTALVSPDGFVRSLNASYVVESVSQPRRFRYHFAYENVGETVLETPSWVAEWNSSDPAVVESMPADPGGRTG